MEMFELKMSTRRLVANALLAAVYAALTLAFSFCSFGPIQLRVAEVLCILPFFLPFSAWGLFAGCIVSNLLSPAGLPDMVFGSLATLLAALCTAKARGLFGGKLWPERIFACLMPVLWNGIVVGAVLTYASGALRLGTFALYALEVAAGEAVVLFVLGLPLMSYLPRTSPFVSLCRAYGVSLPENESHTRTEAVNEDQ